MSARVPFPLLLVALLGAACTARAPRPDPLPDCAGAEAYEFMVAEFETFETDAGELPWFAFGDCTPGAEHPIRVEPIPSGRCASGGALVFRTSGHQDWGSGFGTYRWNSEASGPDASEYEGLSFWARAPGHSDKGINVGIGDRQSSLTGGICRGNDAGMDDGLCASEGGVPPTEPNTDAGLPPAKGTCGNTWSQQIIVSEFWKLHLLPWQTFAQEPIPSRVEAIDPTGIYEFAINIPKDSSIELWIDDLGFYRRKPAGL